MSEDIPSFFYGTAWKEEATAELTYQALKVGFQAIDTANQRKHYFEEGVGLGIEKYLKNEGQGRKYPFLQTKFTYARGQDQRKPYDESDPFAKQVADSFASSLEHLRCDFIDSYVLHGHYHPQKVGEEDFETWSAMEELVDQGKVRYLGVSNTSVAQLSELFEKARVKPRFVQNRCYARTGWDKAVRDYCRAQNIKYQGFSLLTANANELSSKPVYDMALRHGKQIPQLVFRFSQQIGMIPLTGTTNPEHMREDLNIADFELSEEEVRIIEQELPVLAPE